MEIKRFNYAPLMLPTSLTVNDDIAMFATTYPQQYRWLCGQDWCRITCFRWPEMMGRLLHDQIGMVVCEFQVEVSTEIADQFATVKSAVPK